MSLLTRASSQPPPSGPNPGGTPKHLHLTPTHSNLRTLLAQDTSLIRSLPNTCKWLESNGWILMAEPYNQVKIISILATTALYSKLAEMKNAVLAMAFLLEADVMDQISSSLADAIMTKTMGRLSDLVKKLGTMAKFLTANNAQRAESTLTLKLTSETLAGVSSLLDAMASKFANPPQQPIAPPTWASIAKTSASPQPATVHSHQTSTPAYALSTNNKICVQQHVICNVCTVLIKFNPMNDSAPTNPSLTGTSKLWNALNKTLKTLDDKQTSLNQGKDREIEVTMPKTHAIGLEIINSSVYLAEFDTADSADRFRHYVTEHWEVINDIFGNSLDIMDKTFNLIVRFVPCKGPFDPDNFNSLHTIELENSLPSMSITSALWLKNPDLRSPKQSVASLKITCNNPKTTNNMIHGQIFICS
ncbi:hypothetical protein C0989_010093 [Termitomyces sp. Mn162]|nr:hypothetical protein C0989_010093 [Termitomyces sp. Mn162]